MALGVAAVIGLGGCGGSTRHASSHTAPGTPPNGATVRTARCLLWNVLDPPARAQLIRGLRTFFTQRLDTGAQFRVLPDAQAEAVITSFCRLPFARGFLLYRLYGNATAFRAPRPAAAR